MDIENGDVVRIITWEGKVSEDLFTVECAKNDNKGLVLIQDKHKKPIKVIRRRVIPATTDGMAIVVEAGSKFKAVCPVCPNVFEVNPTNTQIRCAEHGIYKLYWLGDKPMTDTTNDTTELTAEKKEKPMAKDNKEPIKVDIQFLAQLENCELWEKNVVNFNHHKISVVSYALICTSEPARKLCFNTYDGTLGKRNTEHPLPVAAFLEANPEMAAVKVWHPIKDLDKERSALQKKGYELVNVST